jgi:hypothetical protein
VDSRIEESGGESIRNDALEATFLRAKGGGDAEMYQGPVQQKMYYSDFLACPRVKVLWRTYQTIAFQSHLVKQPGVSCIC